MQRAPTSSKNSTHKPRKIITTKTLLLTNKLHADIRDRLPAYKDRAVRDDC